MGPEHQLSRSALGQVLRYGVTVMARLDIATNEMVEFASQGGAPDALFELGLMYCAGRDVPLDLVQAHKWFNLAAVRGNAEAKRYRVELAAEMSKYEIAEAQRQAREWLAKH
jgi:TPR repeat protein